MHFSLTPYQRLNLLNQYKILEELACMNNDEDAALYYARNARIVAEGYTLHYGEFQAEITDELPEDAAKLVWDTLSMYAAIYRSYGRLSDPKLAKEQIAFRGFDGNYETKLMDYCRFIVSDLDGFDELRGNAIGFNAHSERRKTYEAMLRKWTEMGTPSEMNEVQIRTLIES